LITSKEVFIYSGNDEDVSRGDRNRESKTWKGWIKRFPRVYYWEMRILIDIGHPADVHFFKNMIRNLGKKGHEIKITARKKDVTLDLLNAYHFKYEYLGENRRGLMKKAYGMIKKDYMCIELLKDLNRMFFLDFITLTSHRSEN